MTEGNQWTLEEIRSAYADILRAYNLLFPLHPETKKYAEDITGSFEKGEESLLEIFRIKTKEIVPKLKDAADKSGNAQIWRAGEPFDNLNQGMRARIERALRLGI